jgi:hypothetical protein
MIENIDNEYQFKKYAINLLTNIVSYIIKRYRPKIYIVNYLNDDYFK